MSGNIHQIDKTIFSFYIDEHFDILVIHDHSDVNGKTVTNAAEEVLAHIKTKIEGGILPSAIIYRDSTGIYDGMDYHYNGGHPNVTFWMMRTCETLPAMKLALLRRAALMVISQARDTIGVIAEFNAMPCDSLQAKLPTTAYRLEAAINKAVISIP